MYQLPPLSHSTIRQRSLSKVFEPCNKMAMFLNNKMAFIVQLLVKESKNNI